MDLISKLTTISSHVLKNHSIVSLAILEFLILSFSGNNTLNAQYLDFGIKGSWCMPYLSRGTNEISRDWQSRSVLNFGVFGSTYVSKNISIQIEVNYASQGGQKNGIQPIPEGAIHSWLSGTTLYANFNSIVKLNYLEVPITIKYSFPRGSPLTYHFIAGTFLGYLINEHNKTVEISRIFIDQNGNMLMIPDRKNPGQWIEIPAQNFDANMTISQDYNIINFGITCGVGWSQEIRNGSFFLDVRGYYGMINIQKYSANGKNNIRAVELSLGYTIKIK